VHLPRNTSAALSWPGGNMWTNYNGKLRTRPSSNKAGFGAWVSSRSCKIAYSAGLIAYRLLNITLHRLYRARTWATCGAFPSFIATCVQLHGKCFIAIIWAHLCIQIGLRAAMLLIAARVCPSTYHSEETHRQTGKHTDTKTKTNHYSTIKLPRILQTRSHYPSGFHENRSNFDDDDMIYDIKF